MKVWLNRIGLGSIFLYSFFASIYQAYFAKIHLTLSFLPFPIFLGECLFIVCFLLWIITIANQPVLSRKSMALLGLYAAWILIKGFLNYAVDGPLTCRNAALFYYAIFAVFAYCFYLGAGISRRHFSFLVAIDLIFTLFKGVSLYFGWTYLLLLLLAVLCARSSLMRRIGWIVLVAAVLIGWDYIYRGSRSNSVSILGSVFFLALFCGSLLLKQRRMLHLGVLAASFFVFILGFFVLLDHNKLRTITSLKVDMAAYKREQRLYEKEKLTFVRLDLKPQLYNPEHQGIALKSAQALENENKAKVTASPIKTVVHNLENGLFFRTFDVSCPISEDADNVIFRLFVWRDMVQELIQKKAWWGFSFGHPQRSKSLEVLNWARSEWTRDGWITPHNFFLHVIYRAGVLGVGFLIFFFSFLGRLAWDFYKLKSFQGGVLIAILIYWMILASFLVILEFPYDAIFFWSLLGLTTAYRNQLLQGSIK